MGRLLKQHTLRGPADAIHINVSGQEANTLLHDGHAWKDFPQTLLSATRRALRAAPARFAFTQAQHVGQGELQRDAVQAQVERQQSEIDAMKNRLR